MLGWFKEMVVKFFPKIRLSRYQAWQKKHILDMCEKFQRSGGTIKEFCKAIGKSHETLTRWLKVYEQYGMAGLTDKKSRPQHFARKIPHWPKDELLILFLRHPQWTAYQYYKYIRDNPAINYSVSLPTISKLKEVHQQKTDAEKERIKKRWAFAPNYSVWTVDYTVLLKTDLYKIQLLTVSDQRSRFLFETALFIDTSTDTLMSHLEDLFIKYGKPSIIKADNGPEMRVDLRDQLQGFCVHLLNSPTYYGQFCGAHERIHRELKTFIDKFVDHRDLMKLAEQIKNFTEDHNHNWTYEILANRTPAEIYYSDEGYIPDNVEVIMPYIKDDELRMKFTNRNGKKARISIPHIGEST